jgi:hypothetical protein
MENSLDLRLFSPWEVDGSGMDFDFERVCLLFWFRELFDFSFAPSGLIPL